MDDKSEENSDDTRMIDGIGDVNSSEREEKSSDNDYEISRSSLSLYFHLFQFLPALIVVLVICALVLPTWGIWFTAALFFLLYIVLYKASSVIAERRANSVNYKFEDNVLTAEGSYCGFYSQKTVPLDQVSKITLMQSPLMRFCKIWTIKFDMVDGRSKVRLYGLKNAKRLREALLYARAAVINSTEHSAR